MKKLLALSLLASISCFGQTNFQIGYGITDYVNSKTKIDGETLEASVQQNFGFGSAAIGYEDTSADRIGTNPTLEVQKTHLKYNHNLGQEGELQIRYLSIEDNIAPTDDGKIYGIGGVLKKFDNLSLAAQYYQSDYVSFNVNQYDLIVSKNFIIDDWKGKISLNAKQIEIDGEKYGNYVFKDKDYSTLGVNLGVNYSGYFANIGAMFGKRLFAVLEDGAKVQHHAVEQDKTYMLAFGKKFKSFDLMAKYSFQNGIELPENQKDVDTKTTMVSLVYKF